MTGWLVLLVLILLATGLSLMLFLAASLRNSAPAVMTPPEVLYVVLEALDLPERGLLIDPGCGDGRVLSAALKSREELRVLGIDNNPVLVVLAKLRLRKRSQVKFGNMVELNFRAANRVFLYLSPRLMEVLEPKLRKELRPGARVVSMHYAFSKRHPSGEISISGAPAHARKLYIYEY